MKKYKYLTAYKRAYLFSPAFEKAFASQSLSRKLRARISPFVARHLLIYIMPLLLLLASCNKSGKNESDKSVAERATVDKFAESIFNLHSKWQTEEAKEIELKDLKGKVLVMVMIYTRCKVACPRLVADMQNIAKQIPAEKKQDIQYILVSIDPTNDNPEVLKKFAITNFMDGDEWTFLQGNEQTVREFANVLAVKYKEIAPMDFSHSNIISVFDQNGLMVHQQEGLGLDNKETIAKIIETAKNKE